jgi:hypothetical protein
MSLQPLIKTLGREPLLPALMRAAFLATLVICGSLLGGREASANAAMVAAAQTADGGIARLWQQPRQGAL